jgi:hypothetical protein
MRGWITEVGGQKSEVGGRRAEDRSRRSEGRGQEAPVKFATLVFFEEFNGVNRGRRTEVGGRKSEVRENKRRKMRRLDGEPATRSVEPDTPALTCHNVSFLQHP